MPSRPNGATSRRWRSPAGAASGSWSLVAALWVSGRRGGDRPRGPDAGPARHRAATSSSARRSPRSRGRSRSRAPWKRTSISGSRRSPPPWAAAVADPLGALAAASAISGTRSGARRTVRASRISCRCSRTGPRRQPRRRVVLGLLGHVGGPSGSASRASALATRRRPATARVRDADLVRSRATALIDAVGAIRGRLRRRARRSVAGRPAYVLALTPLVDDSRSWAASWSRSTPRPGCRSASRCSPRSDDPRDRGRLHERLVRPDRSRRCSRSRRLRDDRAPRRGRRPRMRARRRPEEQGPGAARRHGPHIFGECLGVVALSRSTGRCRRRQGRCCPYAGPLAVGDRRRSRRPHLGARGARGAWRRSRNARPRCRDGAPVRGLAKRYGRPRRRRRARPRRASAASSTASSARTAPARPPRSAWRSG